jgi:hypothetical protein
MLRTPQQTSSSDLLRTTDTSSDVEGKDVPIQGTRSRGGSRDTAALIHTLDTALCVGSRSQSLKAGNNSTGDSVSCRASLDVSANFNFEHYLNM